MRWRALSRGGFYVVRNRNAAVLACELKRSFSGGCRLGFQVGVRSLRFRRSVQPTLCRRARVALF
eukprot:4504568-Pyramimonas_sp.AAC.1